jgi:hypothetical protein
VCVCVVVVVVVVVVVGVEVGRNADGQFVDRDVAFQHSPRRVRFASLFPVWFFPDISQLTLCLLLLAQKFVR